MKITKKSILIALSSILTGLGVGILAGHLTIDVDGNMENVASVQQLTPEEKREFAIHKRNFEKILPLLNLFYKESGKYNFIKVGGNILLLYTLGKCRDDLDLSKLSVEDEDSEEEREGTCKGQTMSMDYDHYEDSLPNYDHEKEINVEKIEKNDKKFLRKYLSDNYRHNIPKIANMLTKQKGEKIKKEDEETSFYTNDVIVLPPDNLFIQMCYRYKETFISFVCKNYQIPPLELPSILIHSFKAIKQFWETDTNMSSRKAKFYNSVFKYILNFKARFSLRQYKLSKQINLIFKDDNEACYYRKFLSYFFRKYSPKYLLYDKINNRTIYAAYRICFKQIENLLNLESLIIFEDQISGETFDLVDFMIFVDRNMSELVSKFH